jgi:hypothetical protein
MGRHQQRTDNQGILPQHQDSTKMELKLPPNFTAMVNAHGKTKAYLHRFKITVPGMYMHPRRTDNRPSLIWLRITGQRNGQTNSIHFKRKWLAISEKWPSEKILKTILNVCKLHRLWKTVKSRGPNKQKQIITLKIILQIWIRTNLARSVTLCNGVCRNKIIIKKKFLPHTLRISFSVLPKIAALYTAGALHCLLLTFIVLTNRS